MEFIYIYIILRFLPLGLAYNNNNNCFNTSIMRNQSCNTR